MKTVLTGLVLVLFMGCAPASQADLSDSAATLESHGLIDASPMADTPSQCSCQRIKCEADTAKACSVSCDAPSSALCTCADCSAYSTFNMCRCVN
ncbi:MAG: hypothetical protein R3C68_15350 [Myxococcota bacterium]